MFFLNMSFFSVIEYRPIWWSQMLLFQVSQIKTPQTQDDEFIEIQSETGTAFQRFMVRHMTLVKQVFYTDFT